jgi:C4-dicarboxylate-specific signal transduction histidine kinase
MTFQEKKAVISITVPFNQESYRFTHNSMITGWPVAFGQMSVETSAQRARAHLHEMISLANRLITESVNPLDPIEPPDRTISKADFTPEYLAHSSELCELLENPSDDEDGSPVDEELAQARAELTAAVTELEAKLNKLNDLRFWMDNLLIDT